MLFDFGNKYKNSANNFLASNTFYNDCLISST